MNKAKIVYSVLVFILIVAVQSCKEGDDGKAYMTLIWTDVTADTIFVSSNSDFPSGNSISHITKNGEIVCTVKAYNTNFDSLKGEEYEVEPGNFCYGTVSSGVTTYHEMTISVEEGGPVKEETVIFFKVPAGNGDKGSDRHYSVSLDAYTFVE